MLSCKRNIFLFSLLEAQPSSVYFIVDAAATYNVASRRARSKDFMRRADLYSRASDNETRGFASDNTRIVPRENDRFLAVKRSLSLSRVFLHARV